MTLVHHMCCLQDMEEDDQDSDDDMEEDDEEDEEEEDEEAEDGRPWHLINRNPYNDVIDSDESEKYDVSGISQSPEESCEDDEEEGMEGQWETGADAALEGDEEASEDGESEGSTRAYSNMQQEVLLYDLA